MRIRSVVANAHKQVFEVRTARGDFVLPYFKTEPAPSREDPVAECFVDPELGKEGFTYTLSSGADGSVHLDAVLEYNEDPTSMADLVLYRLTTEVRKRFDASPMSAREAARKLGTSPAQLYRLLDPTNYSKSARQLLSLVYALGHEVELDIRS